MVRGRHRAPSKQTRPTRCPGRAATARWGYCCAEAPVLGGLEHFADERELQHSTMTASTAAANWTRGGGGGGNPSQRLTWLYGHFSQSCMSVRVHGSTCSSSSSGSSSRGKREPTAPGPE
jgi:hypothetical protein